MLEQLALRCIGLSQKRQSIGAINKLNTPSDVSPYNNYRHIPSGGVNTTSNYSISTDPLRLRHPLRSSPRDLGCPFLPCCLSVWFSQFNDLLIESYESRLGHNPTSFSILTTSKMPSIPSKAITWLFSILLVNVASAALNAADYYVHSLPGAPDGPFLKMHAG